MKAFSKKLLRVTVLDNNGYEYTASSFFNYITGIVNTLLYHDQFAEKNLVLLANTFTIHRVSVRHKNKIRYTILLKYINTNE